MGAITFKNSFFFLFFFSLLASTAPVSAEETFPLDEESALYEELEKEKAAYLRKEFLREKLSKATQPEGYYHDVGFKDFLKKTFGVGSKKQSHVSAAPIVRATPLYQKIHVEILKVKTNKSGQVIDSILGVTDRDGIPQELILVSIDGQLTFVWPTSTAQSYKQRRHNKRGMVTPSTSEGVGYTPQSLVRYKKSTAYGDGTVVNMPYAIFFNGGIAVHGTTPDHYNELGEKDSGGCSRLYQPHAAILWAYVNPTGAEEIYSGATLNEIKNRVRIDVYGFDGTSAATRAAIKSKYWQGLPWIQQQLTNSLDQIASRQ